MKNGWNNFDAENSFHFCSVVLLSSNQFALFDFGRFRFGCCCCCCCCCGRRRRRCVIAATKDARACVSCLATVTKRTRATLSRFCLFVNSIFSVSPAKHTHGHKHTTPSSRNSFDANWVQVPIQLCLNRINGYRVIGSHTTTHSFRSAFTSVWSVLRRQTMNVLIKRVVSQNN